MTTEPTEKHREEAMNLVQVWSADTFDSLRNGETLHLPRGAMSTLSNRVAKVLSARDAEIREVLAGLITHHVRSEDRRIARHWCLIERDGYYECRDACLAARELYEKLQPAKESNDD